MQIIGNLLLRQLKPSRQLRSSLPSRFLPFISCSFTVTPPFAVDTVIIL